MTRTVAVVISMLSLAEATASSHDGMLRTTIGGAGYDGGFMTLSPDPSVLIWDKNSSAKAPGFRAGWLKVPVLHDAYITPFEKSPQACLRVVMKPAAKQPAKLGPILLHCGGPGSDATCAFFWGKWLEMNSSYLVGPPLSEDYDYWSISQRGMSQENLAMYGFDSKCPFQDERGDALPSWPTVKCNGIDKLEQEKGTEEVLKRLDGGSDTTWAMIQSVRKGPDAQTFGVPFFNETYVRWAYRVMALEHNLCFEDEQFKLYSPVTNRSYNTLNHLGTDDLAQDIEIVRTAIGASKMSVYGVSYGTKVGSVYATMFPDKVHRLILDGDMGSDPDVEVFANWVGESTEAVWTGLAESCDNSVMAGGPPEAICPAGPGVTAKLHALFKNARTAEEKTNAIPLFFALSSVIYDPGAHCASELMNCMANLHATKNVTSCQFNRFNVDRVCQQSAYPWPSQWMGTGGVEQVGAVLGMDLAGRLTEESFINWWSYTKEKQPLGITRSLMTTIAVGTWPAMPRPQPPAGDPVVAPLVIGNLYDGQTPYKMAQRMIESFPSGRLLTSQFYGHGLQGPDNYTAVVEQYEDEKRRGVVPTYTDGAAKLLCVKVALEYLKDGTLARDHVCKAPGPKQTWPGTTTTTTQAIQREIFL